MTQAAAYARFVRLSRGDRRRRRRDRRTRRQLHQEPVFQITLTAEERRRQLERKEYIDAAVAYLANYTWLYFITLTFRESLGPEAIQRAIRRFTKYIHENVFGEFDEVRDVRDLFGIRYFPILERGQNASRRLHAHLNICGGEVLGERLQNAKWEAWRQWWNREYGGLRIERPQSQGDVAAYCTKYLLKGDEAGFELCSTWADERDRRKRGEAPLIEDRKVGIDVTKSADLEKNRYVGEAPRGCGVTSKGSGKVCHRCGLVSMCRCWGSGQVVTTPEPGAGACEGAVSVIAAPSPQIELRMQQQLTLHASANKSGRFSSRREKRLARWSAWKLRKARQVLSSSAACNVISST